MSIELIDTCDIPAYALPYLVNGDDSGLEDDDINIIDGWLQGITGFDSFSFIIDADAEPSFTFYPEFGKACDCYECDVYGHPVSEAKS